MNLAMSVVLAECTRSYEAGTRKLVAGTVATVVATTTHPVASLTLQVGEEDAFDVPVRDFGRFWKTKIGP
jgi:hypothetical protein